MLYLGLLLLLLLLLLLEDDEESEEGEVALEVRRGYELKFTGAGAVLGAGGDAMNGGGAGGCKSPAAAAVTPPQNGSFSINSSCS